LEVTPTSISFNKEGGTQSFVVASNVTWTATRPDADSWLTITGGSGTGNGSVSLSAAAYSGSDPRTTTVTVSGEGLSRDVIVTQLGDKLQLIVAPDEVAFTEFGGDFDVTVSTNVDWNAEITETSAKEWLAIKKSIGNDKLLTISAQPLSTSESRSTTIRVYGGGLEQMISVLQTNGILKLSVHPEGINFSYNGGTTSLEIQSNIKWKVTCSADWLQITKGSGSNNDNVSLTALANSGQKSRSAKVIVSGGGRTCKVTVTQEGKEINPINANNLSVEDNNTFIKESDAVLLVEYKKGIELMLTPKGDSIFNSDNWNYTWQVDDGTPNEGISITRTIDQVKRYTLKAKMTYKADESIFFEKTFNVYPKPSQPTLVLKGNGTSNILIAKMDDGVYETYEEREYVFGHGSNDDGDYTGKYRYYQYKNGLQNDHWVKYRWTIEGKAIDSEKGTWNNLQQNNRISIKNARLVAHCETPTAAIVTVHSFAGKVKEQVVYGARCDFDEQLDLKSLPAGMYIIRATVGDQVTEEKFVVK